MRQHAGRSIRSRPHADAWRFRSLHAHSAPSLPTDYGQTESERESLGSRRMKHPERRLHGLKYRVRSDSEVFAAISKGPHFHVAHPSPFDRFPGFVYCLKCKSVALGSPRIPSRFVGVSMTKSLRSVFAGSAVLIPAFLLFCIPSVSHAQSTAVAGVD